MSKSKHYLIGGGIAGLLVSMLFCGGCEVDSASSELYITPDSVALSDVGQSVTLTCVGGYQCSWSLATENWGRLNTRRGDQVIYTSEYRPADGLPVVQVVTVSSRFSSMSGQANLAGATNASMTNAQYATAYITHLPATTNTANEIQP